MLLGLDLGTTNVKALLAERGGRVVGVGSAPVPLRHVGADGVEQDIEQIWQATLAAVGRLPAATLAEVETVGISSQGGAMQLADADGRPAGPVISWLDGRGRPWDRRITDELGRDWFARRIGHGGSGITIGQVLRLREQQPGLLTAATRVGFVGDAICRRLCGRAAHDATSLSLGMLYNPALDREDPDVLSRLAITAEQLPDLLPATEPAGGLLADVAARTGLPAGIPVSPAVHDQYAAALGCGAVHGGDVMFGAGTAWVLLAVAERLAAPVIDSAFVCRHVAAGLFGQIVSLGNGGSSLTWAVQTLGLAGAGREQLDELMAAVGPGSAGLRFWPFLAPGYGAAGLAGRVAGRLDGLRLSHTPGHVLRSVVEGLACELARYLQFLTAAGLAVRRLILCGGAAASRVTPQIVADTTGLPVACVAEAETSALGAAILARRLVEPAADLATLAERMAPPTRQIEPGADAAAQRDVLRQYIASLPLAAASGR